MTAGVARTTRTARVALVGAAGHGAWHLRAIADLQANGVVELVGVADVADVPTVPAGVPTFRRHEDLLAGVAPEIVVVCTPPHTHLPIATDVLRSGADLLLEKPPVLDLAEHDRLTAVLAETGRACQVGFQALGSAALVRLRAAIAAGQLGTVTGIAARGAWVRPDAYFRRAAWVGRRTLDGRPVLDGALVNPFAHAVMQVLAIAGSVPIADPSTVELSTVELSTVELSTVEPSTVEVERYRAHDIEVDDTAGLRLRFGPDLVAVVAVTLCAEEFVPGDITVTGTAGTAVLEYPTDRLRLPGETELTEVPGRISLLANLVDHRAGGAALIAPLAATRGFTALLAPILAAAPVEVPVPPGDPVRIPGINAAVGAAADRLALFSELGLPWAVTPVATTPR